MSLIKSITTFGGWTLVSRITGFMRDVILASFLGAGAVSDAFFVAFKLPNLFRSLFAEGAFTSAFVPLFSQKIIDSGKDGAIKFAAQALSVLVVVLTIFVIIIEIFMPYMVVLLAPGFVGDIEKIELATFLSRITFPFLLFISVVSFQSGILNSLGKFAAPASAPIILNLTMILSIYAFMPIIDQPAYRVAIGVTIAGFLEILWLTYFLKKEKVYIKPQFDILTLLKSNEITTLFKRIAPGVVGAGVYQINMIIDTILVSMVATGAISWLYYANRIQQLPLGVVGAAIGVASLPILSRQLKAGNTKEAQITQDNAIEYGAILSFPAAIAMIVLAKPIVSILFEHGKFGAYEVIMTSKAVMVYAFGLPAYVMVKALTPNFFARGDVITPVKYSMVVVICNLIMAISLMQFFGHVGIVLATTISAFISLLQYIRGLKNRSYWHFSNKLKWRICKIGFSALVMGAAIVLADFAITKIWGDWLEQIFIYKLAIFCALSVLAIVTFAIMIKITNIMNICTVFKQQKGQPYV